jgi:hypothetical protein
VSGSVGEPELLYVLDGVLDMLSTRGDETADALQQYIAEAVREIQALREDIAALHV